MYLIGKKEKKSFTIFNDIVLSSIIALKCKTYYLKIAYTFNFVVEHMLAHFCEGVYLQNNVLFDNQIQFIQCYFQLNIHINIKMLVHANGAYFYIECICPNHCKTHSIS